MVQGSEGADTKKLLKLGTPVRSQAPTVCAGSMRAACSPAFSMATLALTFSNVLRIPRSWHQGVAGRVRAVCGSTRYLVGDRSYRRRGRPFCIAGVEIEVVVEIDVSRC